MRPVAKKATIHPMAEIKATTLATCPQCGGPVTLIAAIEDPAVIVKILSHLDLPTRAPPRAPARLDEFLQTA